MEWCSTCKRLMSIETFKQKANYGQTLHRHCINKQTSNMQAPGTVQVAGLNAAPPLRYFIDYICYWDIYAWWEAIFEQYFQKQLDHTSTAFRCTCLIRSACKAYIFTILALTSGQKSFYKVNKIIENQVYSSEKKMRSSWYTSAPAKI